MSKRTYTNEMKEPRYCNKCNNEVTESKLDEYSYECVECDEDLFEFETHSSNPLIQKKPVIYLKNLLEDIKDAVAAETSYPITCGEMDIANISLAISTLNNYKKALEEIAHHAAIPIDGKANYEKTVCEFIDIAKSSLI